ncbi:ABC transporter ATP-binding protein [Photobacterium alginatilyticum]|uniref:ABC transporter ATP-binding protein n=1 Tax=Photobacterium alginatilyticum TaxID=1775171 RepID=A0ABW9YLU5_9GAMM|nr:ABC transporter ATP-binding protein [Photobacterium alginatilyticum]NBI54789.1 ABC transporter ATP-binding protein [Photobacterium alginatilyticum]
MLRIRKLRFAYSQTQFQINIAKLDIAGGETLALIGPSGSGKTTLLNLLAGILKPDSGTIFMGEQCISAMHSAQARRYRLQQVGMVFQGFELLPYLSVLDNILLTARLLGGFAINEELRHRADKLAMSLGIADKLRRPVNELSQGERQRVAICRALLLQPPIILADEPTGNLDPRNKHLALEKIIDETKANNSALLTVTHDHSLLGQFDRVVDLDDFICAEES